MADVMTLPRYESIIHQTLLETKVFENYSNSALEENLKQSIKENKN